MAGSQKVPAFSRLVACLLFGLLLVAFVSVSALNSLLTRQSQSASFLAPRAAGQAGAAPPEPLRILHVTDSHMSLADETPGRSTRMFEAMAHSQDYATGEDTTPMLEFAKVLQRARQENVDLIALGGDIVNFPSPSTVAFAKKSVLETGKPYVFISGNHDWMLEGMPRDVDYDVDRLPELHASLWPLVEDGMTAPEKIARTVPPYPTAGGMSEPEEVAQDRERATFGCVSVKGVDVVTIDNGNYQVSEQQLRFFKRCLARSEKAPAECGRCPSNVGASPVVLLLHIPLALPGLNLPPKESCGDPTWGAATDENHDVEGRPMWPEGNKPSTVQFVDVVRRNAAPVGRIVTLLAGHIHRETVAELGQTPELASTAGGDTMGRWSGTTVTTFTDPSSEVLRVGPGEAARQYTTRAALEGGYRIFTVQLASEGKDAL